MAELEMTVTVPAAAAAATCPVVSDRKRKAPDHYRRSEVAPHDSIGSCRKRPALPSGNMGGLALSSAEMCTDEPAGCDHSMDRVSDSSSEMEDNSDDASAAATQQLLQDACANGNRTAVDQLLSTGMSIAATSPEGLTLLHLVAKGSGSVACGARLLRAGPALLTVRCRAGWTAALYAAQAGNWDLVSLLETWL